MKVKKFFYYFIIPVFKPVTGVRRLLQDKNRVLYGFLLFLTLGILYTITVFIGWKNGFGAVVEPFVKIPAEKYYFYQMFYQIPLFIVIMVLFAGTARLLAMVFHGQGSFENLFAVTCVSMTLPMFLTMWLPESMLMICFPGHRLTPLGGFKIFPMWFEVARQIAGLLWPVVMIVKGTSLSEKVHWLVALFIALVAAVPMTALMLVFVR